MAGADITTVIENSIRNYLSKTGVNPDLWNISSAENSIAGIVYDPSEEIRAKRDTIIEKIKTALSKDDSKTALSHMNDGIDRKIISCDDYESDWDEFIDGFSDHYWNKAEVFIRDFIGRIERKEVSTKIPLPVCYEMLASSMVWADVEGKRRSEAIAAICKAIEFEKDPKRTEILIYLKDIYSQR